MAAETNFGDKESSEVRTFPVVLTAALVLGTVALIGFGFELLFPDRIGLSTITRHDFPKPAVLPGELEQRLGLEAEQRRDLTGANGRKSIEDAMREIAGKGTQAYGPIGAPP